MWRIQQKANRIAISTWIRSRCVTRTLGNAAAGVAGNDSIFVVRFPPTTAVVTSSSSSSSARCFSTANIDDDDLDEHEVTTPVLPPTKVLDSSSKWLRPSEVVRELDKHIVGQQDAKRTIANAFRMRWRRRQLPEDLKKEVKPRNVLLIGPTGCGKTEIARKMADLCKAPFIKVEATKYTEVGYHGRDVDQIIRDLVENAIHLVKKEKTEEFREEAKEMVEELILDALVGQHIASQRPPTTPSGVQDYSDDDHDDEDEDHKEGESIKPKGEGDDASSSTGPIKQTKSRESRERFRNLLKQGVMENMTVNIDIPRTHSGGTPGDRSFGRAGGVDVSSSVVIDALVKGLSAVVAARGEGRDGGGAGGGGGRPSNNEKRHVTVAEARELLLQIQVDKMLESVDLKKEAIEAVEERGIAFIDEIDKIVMPREAYRNTDASAEGVQRDLLPVVEGTTIDTKYGNINTDHILFIASGAFHAVKPSDMLPELQGRFPIRVELKGLGENDLYRILTEPVANLVLQQVELMKTEGVRLVFTEDGTREIARLAALANKEMENIGARRLHTVMERIVDQVSFEAPDLEDGTEITVDKKFVSERLQDMVVKSDQSKYIL